MRNVILDTGPLVALLDADEEHHAWAVDQMKDIQAPLLTCDAVISEACFLLLGNDRAVGQIAEYFNRGVLDSQFRFSECHKRIFPFMKKYRDVPMAFADACLVCMVEDISSSVVFTLDEDFRIYRQQGRRLIPVICP